MIQLLDKSQRNYSTPAIMERGWKYLISTLTLVAVITGAGYTPTALGAETVVVRQGPFEVSIAVADLKTFAATGKAPPRLQRYLRALSPTQQTLVYHALTTQINLGVIGVSQLLNARIGELILNDLATITLRNDGAEVLALRAALVLGTRAPGGLSILSVLEAYPSRFLKIDLNRAFAVMSQLNRDFWQTQQFMTAIIPYFPPALPDLFLPFDPRQPGTQSITIRQFTLKDARRSREIPVDLYEPAQPTQTKPVVIITHGRGSIRSELAYLAEHLASHGYIVITPEHPGSNQEYLDRNLTLMASEFLDRPQDLSFILDHLETLNQQDQRLRGTLATDQVLVLGYSFGGGTALAIAGAEMQIDSLRQTCQNPVIQLNLAALTQCVASGLPQDRYQLFDSRVKGVIALNPTASLLFGETGLQQLQVPTLIFTTSADQVTPALTEQVIPFSQVPAPKWLIGVLGGTHLSAKDPIATLAQADRGRNLFGGNEIVGDAATQVRDYVKAFTLGMAGSLSQEPEAYQVFLTPEYYQLISTDNFPVRLVTEIPPEAQIIINSLMQNLGN